MSIAQLSPVIVVANPANVNPLAHTANNISAAAAGSLAQQKADRAKSDSVTISREALEKAAKAEKRTDHANGALVQDAPEKAAKK